MNLEEPHGTLLLQVDPIEQKLERRVRLRALQNLRAEQQQRGPCRRSRRPRSRRRRDTPGPTPSRCGAASCESNHATGFTPRAAASGPSVQTGLLSKKTSVSVVHAGRDRARRVDVRAQDRARRVELRLRQRLRRSRRDDWRSAASGTRARFVADVPIAITVPPFSMNCLQLRQRAVGRDRADLIAVLGGNVLRSASRRRPPPPPPRPPRPPPAPGIAPPTKINVSYFALRLPASSSGAKTRVERELELLENPARPAGVNRAAVLIPEADAAPGEPRARGRRLRSSRREVHAALGRGFLDDRR